MAAKHKQANLFASKCTDLCQAKKVDLQCLAGNLIQMP